MSTAETNQPSILETSEDKIQPKSSDTSEIASALSKILPEKSPPEKSSPELEQKVLSEYETWLRKSPEQREAYANEWSAIFQAMEQSNLVRSPLTDLHVLLKIGTQLLQYRNLAFLDEKPPETSLRAARSLQVFGQARGIAQPKNSNHLIRSLKINALTPEGSDVLSSLAAQGWDITSALDAGFPPFPSLETLQKATEIPSNLLQLLRQLETLPDSPPLLTLKGLRVAFALLEPGSLQRIVVALEIFGADKFWEKVRASDKKGLSIPIENLRESLIETEPSKDTLQFTLQTLIEKYAINESLANAVCSNPHLFKGVFAAEVPQFSLEQYKSVAEFLALRQPESEASETEKGEYYLALNDFRRVFLTGELVPAELSGFAAYGLEDAFDGVLQVIEKNLTNLEDFSKDGQVTSRFFLEIIQESAVPEAIAQKLTAEYTQQLPAKEQIFWDTWKKLTYSQPFLNQMIKERQIGEVDDELVETVQELRQLDIFMGQASPEVQRYTSTIYDSVLGNNASVEMVRQTVRVLESSVPDIAKYLKLFELSYLQKNTYTGLSGLETELKRTKEAELSPTLLHYQDKGRKIIIFLDLIRNQIETANPSFVLFLERGEKLEALLQQQPLTETDTLFCEHYLQDALLMLQLLQENPLVLPENSTLSELLEQVQALCHRKPEVSLSNRVVAELFFLAGYSSTAEVQHAIEAKRSEAEQRKRERAKHDILLEKGDLVKGINFDYYLDLFFHGSVAPQYLGFAQKNVVGDLTAFDSDVSQISSKDTTLENRAKLEKTIAYTYAKGTAFSDGGGLMLLIKDRQQFQVTSKNEPPKYLRDKYEVFSAKMKREGVETDHMGVRTGFPPTEIDAFIALDALKTQPDKMKELKLSIILNGMYIPVIDAEGKVLFTPEEYDSLKLSPDMLRTAVKQPESSSLLDAFLKNPLLAEHYQSHLNLAGGEPHTLETHTRAVTSQLDTFLSQDIPQGILSKEDWKIFLTLHDIGKITAQNIVGQSEKQHTYTKWLFPRFLETLDLDPQKRMVLQELVSGDVLGEYFKQQENEKMRTETAVSIKNSAQRCGVRDAQFLDLLKFYYLADAGSYTRNVSGYSGLDELFTFDDQRIKLGNALEEKFSRLQKEILMSFSTQNSS